jgi:cell filamentation protein
VSDRYDTSGSPEGRFQPGSDERVLLNKLGIIDPDEMDDVELSLLEQLTDAIVREVSEDQKITTDDLCEWHRRWLGNVYQWAGQYRSVNMAKDDFHFAASHLVAGLMQKFSDEYLAGYTPCNTMDEEALVNALAVIHVELILIHPFREGNGRLSRLLAAVMALQAGQPLLDFSYMDENKEAYFAAVRAGLDDYAPMTEIFRQVLRVSQQRARG